MLAPHRRAIYFILVGCAAALVHFVTVIAVVEKLALPPLEANVVGWLCAFGVSYTGHYRLTFADHSAPALRSAARFLLISASGFAVNETAYALALRYSPIRYDVLLAIILVAVAVLTYLTSRHWAFARRSP